MDSAPTRQPEGAPPPGVGVRWCDRLVDRDANVWMPIFTTRSWGWLGLLDRPLRGADVSHVPVRYKELCAAANNARSILDREEALLEVFNYLVLHARTLMRSRFRRLRLLHLLRNGFRYRDGSRWVYAPYFLRQLRLDEIVDPGDIDPAAADRPFQTILRRRAPAAPKDAPSSR